jgi:hypothetical protein
MTDTSAAGTDPVDVKKKPDPPAPPPAPEPVTEGNYEMKGGTFYPCKQMGDLLEDAQAMALWVGGAVASGVGAVMLRIAGARGEIIVNPGDWVMKFNGRYLVFTDSEFTTFCAPEVPEAPEEPVREDPPADSPAQQPAE